jgi:thiol:disulfide interchange protein DsbC
MLRSVCVMAVLALAGVLGQAGAQAPAESPDPHTADPRAALVKLLPAGTKVDDLVPSPIPGVYQFVQGAEVSYLTADGKYYLDGNVYDMATRANLTEVLRARARVALINAVPETQMLIFSPKNPLYTITVFTDVDCQYCRKLHSDMAELNKLACACATSSIRVPGRIPRAGARPRSSGARPTAMTRSRVPRPGRNST